MDSEDFHAWDALLQLTMDKASDYGHDRASVLSNVADAMSRIQSSSAPAPTRVADLLVSSLDMADVREVPAKLMDFVNDSLLGAYPSTSHDHVACFWLVRSLTRAIETCPTELVSDLLASVQDGMCVWISDESHVMTEDDYALNVRRSSISHQRCTHVCTRCYPCTRQSCSPFRRWRLPSKYWRSPGTSCIQHSMDERINPKQSLSLSGHSGKCRMHPLNLRQAAGLRNFNHVLT